MKIAVVSSGSIPTERAHSIAVIKNANGFAKLGHSVDLLTVERIEERKNRQSLGDVNDYYDISHDVSIEYFRDRSPFYYNDHALLGYFPSALRIVTHGKAQRILDPEQRISDACVSRDYDICYCRSYRSAEYNVRRGIPTIVETHNPDPSSRHLNTLLGEANRDAFRGLVTISDQLRERFVDAGVPREKTLTVQDGVDVDRYDQIPDKKTCRQSLNLSTTSSLVVYTGTLYEEKGIRHILETAKKVTDATFVLVGGPKTERERWEQYAQTENVDNVRFEGFVPMSEIPLYQTASDALIMPYDTSVNYDIMDLETTSPLKLFEYMAAGRPIISTDIPAIARTIEHNRTGLLAAPNDIDDLASYVSQVLHDEIFAKQLSRRAREEAERYSWESRCQQMLDNFA